MTGMLKEQHREIVLTDVLYGQMVELARHVGGHEYDCLLCQPHHNYWQLEEEGMVTIVDRDHPHDYMKIARLTKQGQEYIGLSQQRRRRRRRMR